MDQSRLEREREFHDERFGGDDEARSASAKYYLVMGNAAACYKQIATRSCRGKRMLEIGCAVGRESVQWAKAGARLTGIDISPEAVTKANAAVAEQGFVGEFSVMNAEELQFPDESFDVIVGAGILHHLDLAAVYAEMARVLTRDGLAVFLEPLGHNPVINLYRRLTPAMRTPDEHPLLIRDIRHAAKWFDSVESHFFNLTTLGAVPLRNSRLFQPTLATLRTLDKGIFLLPFMRRYAWQVVICLRKPRSLRTADVNTANRHAECVM